MAHKTEPQPIPIESQEAGYELRDALLFPIVVGFASIAILLFSSVIATVILLGYFESNNNQSHGIVTLTMPQEQVVPKEAELQVNPERDLAVYKAESELILSSYGWVDSGAGQVRIPIEQAMDLALERDLLQVREE
jgi:hypothetical protein